MIPSFNDYFYPCLLKIAEKTEISFAEIKVWVADYFHLTENDVRETTPSGKNRHSDRCSWTLSYLKKAEFIRYEAPVYEITELGKKTIEEKGESFCVGDVREQEMFCKNQKSSGFWVPAHYTSSGRFVAGYMSRYEYKGRQRRYSKEEWEQLQLGKNTNYNGKKKI